VNMTGEQVLPASIETVWQALNDPLVLKASIPGCQELQVEGGNRMRAVAAVKVGPITARFAGRVALLDLDPPNGYRIEGEGEGGAAGFAKGGATIRLSREGAATRLTYTVDAQVGGKLAQLGARMVDATAKQMSDAFFARFAKEIAAPLEADRPAIKVPDSTPPVEIPLGSLVPIRWLAAAGGGVVAVLAAILFARRRPQRALLPVATATGEPLVIDAALLADLQMLQSLRRRMGKVV
jgi:carbon monoxide dehydrogenase subunit G